MDRMKEKRISVGLMVLGVLFFILLSFGLSWAQNPPVLLVVVRASDDTLWKMTCDEMACSPFSSFPGLFRYQPTVTWDEEVQVWVVVGTASDNSIWMATFNKQGNFNNDWQPIPGLTPSPAGASGSFYGVLGKLSCSSGQIAKWNGSEWECASDESGAGGDITGVTAGTGLTGGGLSGDVTLNVGAGTGISVDADAVSVASTYRVPQGCSGNQVPKWSGSAWVCGTDANSGGDITSVTAGTGLTGGGTVGDVALDVQVPLMLTGSSTAIIGGTHTGGYYGYLGRSTGGVYGSNNAGTNYGVLGSSSYGVVGHSTSGSGVYGESQASGQSGVRGVTDNAAGYAVYGNNISTGTSGYVGGAYGGFFSGGSDHNDIMLGGPIGRINTDSSNENSNLYLSSNNDVVIRLDNDGGENGVFRILNSGGSEVVTVDETGRLTTMVLEITGGADLSEQFDIGKPAKNLSLEPGMLVVIDTGNPGALTLSSRPYDRKVAGIISGAGGVKPGMLMGQKGSEADGTHPVALTGRVYCWADASYGSIEPGDLLTTSEIPGHAMKVTDYPRATGAIIGKAMTGLESGKGLVLVLVTLQ